MKNIRKSSFAIIATLVLVGSFSGYRIAEAARGEGTATIALDGGGASSGVSVVKNTSHVFTVVLTVGASGITANAENPTFTIPAGFTAPDATYVANAGLVVADGDWSIIGGGTCLVESPVAGLTKAVGQVITVDVSTACTVGGGGIITLTYKGTSATVGTLPVDIGTNDVISYTSVKSISLAPNNATLPTITVTDITTATLKVIKHVVNNNGGLLNANNWTLTVSSSNGGSGTGFALGAELPGTTYTLETGHQYSVAESGGSSGYNQSSMSDDCTIASAVGGTTYTCTITNDDNDPTTATLHVIKKVTNDNDGTSTAADFNLYVKLSGTNVTGSPATGIVSPGRSYTLAPGTYVVSEDADSTYTSSFSGACDSSGSVTLIAGNDYSCTITNDDIVQTDDDENDDENVDIKVTKKASPLALSRGPGSVTYTYKVTNKGDVSLHKVSVKDDKCSPVKYVSGDKDHDSRLDTKETWKYSCTKIVSHTETNTVTAKGTANRERVKDTAKATVVVSVPSFPNAGVGPEDEENNFWSNMVQQVSSLFASRE